MALVNIALLAGSIYSVINPTPNQNYLSHLYFTYGYAPYLTHPVRIKEIQFECYKFEFNDNTLPQLPISKIDILTIDEIPALFEFISYGSTDGVRSYYYSLDSDTKKIENYLIRGARHLKEDNGLVYYTEDNKSSILNDRPDIVSNLEDFKTPRCVKGVVLTVEVDSEETANAIRSLKINIPDDRKSVSSTASSSAGTPRQSIGGLYECTNDGEENGNLVATLKSGNSSRTLLSGLSPGSSDKGEGEVGEGYPEEQATFDPDNPPPIEEGGGNLGSHREVISASLYQSSVLEQNYLFFSYHIQKDDQITLNAPNRLEEVRFNGNLLVFDDEAKLPGINKWSLIGIYTSKSKRPILFQIYGSCGYTLYALDKDCETWDNYALVGLEKYEDVDENGTIYYQLGSSDDIKLFNESVAEECIRFSEIFHEDEIPKVNAEESPTLELVIELNEAPLDIECEIEPVDEAEFGTGKKIKPIVYTGDAYRNLPMSIKSAHSQSISNFKSWYMLQLNPNDYSSVVINKTNSAFPNYVSMRYYPLVPREISIPGVDFHTQYVHPSVRKYLCDGNSPSYYYLYKEYLADSKFSKIAKKLLFPHAFGYQLFDVSNPTLNHKNDKNVVINQDVPDNYFHVYEAFPSGSFIGISMSWGGFFYPFYLGVVSLLAEYNIININTPLLGASASAGAATKLGIGMNFYQAIDWGERVIDDYKKNGAIGRINPVLGTYLREMFPNDAHQFLNERIGQVITCYTLYKPLNRMAHVSEYFNKEDLVETILTSSYIPIYSDKKCRTVHRGKYGMDGGLLSRLKTHNLPHTGAERTVYVSAYLDRKLHLKHGFHNIISQYNHTKTDDVNHYLLLKSMQSRFLLIKYKLKNNISEWKELIDSILLYCNHTDDDIYLHTDMRVVKKYLKKEELALIKELVCREGGPNSSTKCFRNRKNANVDNFIPQIGIVEWLQMERDRINVNNDLEIDKDMLDKIKDIVKSPHQLEMDRLALKKLISIISDFLTYIIPPMNLTYYFTKIPSILYVRYTFKSRWSTLFIGNTIEDTRSFFDQGRGAVYRWVVMEYILMENYLYDKYKFYVEKLKEQERMEDPDYIAVIPEQESSMNRSPSREPLYNFQSNQMYYITEILMNLGAKGIYKNAVEDNVENINYINCHKDNAVNHLFVKRNNLVKRAIEIGLLDDTDFTHILTHTHHWLNSN